MKFSKKHRRIGIALVIVTVCMMMSPIPANANMTIGGRYFNHNETAITNNSFRNGLSGWTVTSGIATTSTAVYYDEDPAIDFATGLNNDIVIEQLLDDKSTKNTGIIAFADGKDLLFSFKFKTDYSYATAKAWIGTKSYDRFGVLRWYWNACSPLPGKVSGDAAGSWVTVQQTCRIYNSAMYALAVRIEIIDSVYSAASSSMDGGGAIPQYVIDPRDGGGHVNPGYIDDAQLAVAQTTSTVYSEGSVKVSIVVIIRSVAFDSGTGLNHAVVDIAFAADDSACVASFSRPYDYDFDWIEIEVHMHPVHWLFGYVSDQVGEVNVINLGQSNNMDWDIKPSNDLATAWGVQAATWALTAVVGLALAPVTAGMSLSLLAAAGVGFVSGAIIDKTMDFVGQALVDSDTQATGGRNYYTRTRLDMFPNFGPSYSGVRQMTITNTIDWYYAPNHADYNLQIYGAFKCNAYDRALGITTYLYA